jgi:carboxyl-terminal processing protease
MSKTTKLTVAVLIVAVVAMSFGAGFQFGMNSQRSSEGLDIVTQAWNIVLSDYVDREKIDTANMTRAAIEGMLETLDDPYTSYLEAELYELDISIIEGAFNGIGAYISVENQQLMIIAPIADSPAEAAGILPGDVILEVDGEPVAEMSLAEAIIKIRGPEGSTVSLLILHEGESEPEIIEVTRARVEVPSVRAEMKETMAYIQITDFTERTGDEMEAAVEELTGQNPTGIIMDLRGNPGGLVSTVIEVASYFLEEGTILNIKYNNGKMDTFGVISGTPKIQLPLVVLVDSFSASGSEVLAGALQDYNRATIAGKNTFGKGSVNIFRPLDDGSGLYITTGRWITPGGRLIEGQGIEPDIELEAEGEEAVAWAIDYLNTSQP